ncbi:MAG: hydroxyacid dehydrogenase [Gammaproteobacteria bacterium]|nr:hydroxyacid dehydrogenase [Gammaproteobacteria bacterium]
MSEIVISEFVDQPAMELLSAEFDVLFDPDLYKNPEHLIATCAQSRGLIVRNQTQVTAALLEQCQRLKVIGRLGVGLDNIDMPACAKHNVQVFAATGANAISVAEYVIAGALMLSRGVFFSTDRVSAGEWPRAELVGHEVYEMTLGLIGFGATGQAVAKRALGLEISVIAYDAAIASDDIIWNTLSVRPVAFDQLVRESDIISLHAPLIPETQHIIDAAALASMKSEAMLINAARGGLVDEAALVQALNNGKLGGAMLDVFENEPLPANSHLTGVPNLILTPHIAGLTHEANHRVSMMTAGNVAAALRAK